MSSPIKDAVLRIGVLTVSDRCSAGECQDVSGDTLSTFIKSEWPQGKVIVRDCIPDEKSEIRNVLTDWADNGRLDVILTTGGTGFSPRDVTPEATKSVLDKEAPGLVVAMIQGSMQSTPMAMLSRPVCGVRRRTLIINLPGSVKGCMENFQIIQKQLKHAADLLRDAKGNVEKIHAELAGKSSKIQTKVNAVNVADRARKSPFETIPVEIAQKIVMDQCENGCSTQTRNLRTALGFIIAEDIQAKDPLPPFPASIKDGYAVKVCQELQGGTTLNVRGDSTAGASPEKCQRVEVNYCVRVSTGAPIPSGADAVIQIEDTELLEKTEDGNDEKVIRILKTPAMNQDIRNIGSDIQAGEKVLEKGTKLGPTELGILATVGVTQFKVFKKPVVALLSTGNELQSPNDLELIKGKIRDSNKTTLESLMALEGFQTKDVGIAKDTPQELLDKLCTALSTADILVCTGGVSMGEKDYLKRVLKTDLGAEIHFGSLLMKPGKPTTFATCMYEGRKKYIFGLPGNPVSATVTSYLFVVPACRKLSGWLHPYHTKVKAQAEKELKLDTTRPEYHRVSVSWSTPTGIPIAQSTGNQISSRLLSFNRADALLILPQGNDSKKVVEKGELLEAILLSA